MNRIDVARKTAAQIALTLSRQVLDDLEAGKFSAEEFIRRHRGDVVDIDLVAHELSRMVSATLALHRRLDN